MSRKRILIALSLIILFCGSAFAQLSGYKYIVSGVTGPDTFPTFKAAIDSLNAVGVGAGGVTFNVPSGQTFLEALNVPPITATGTAANPIVFQKTGVTANPLVMPGLAGTLTTSSSNINGDAIIKIGGGDFITFDGIDVHDNPAFVTSAQAFDYGYMLTKVSGTDACKDVTIRNCKITLKQTTTYSCGVFIANLSNTGSSITVTSTGGRHERIFVYNNHIDSSYGGIKQYGYSDVPANAYAYYDTDIQIGVGGGNLFTNFGGSSSTVYVIYTYYADSLQINNNIINGGAGTTGTMYGMYTYYGYNGCIDIINNDISLTLNGTTGSLYGIYNYVGNNNTSSPNRSMIRVCKNKVHDFNYASATSASIYAIYDYSYYALTNYVDSNEVHNITLPGTGSLYGIYAPYDTFKFFRWNKIYNLVKTGASGIIYLAYPISYTQSLVCHDNEIYNCGNSNPTNTSTVYGLYGSSSGVQADMYNNYIYNIYGGNSTMYGCYVSISGTGGYLNYHDNRVLNIRNGAGTLYGAYANGVSSSPLNVYNNVVDTVQSFGTVYGLYSYYGYPANIYNNYVGNIQIDSTTDYLYGMYLYYATNGYVYNNMVCDLRAPRATYYTTPAIQGLRVYGSSGDTWSLYYNSVYLNSPNTYGTTFGTAAVWVYTTTTLVEFKNNIFMNTSTPGVTNGYTVAYQRSSTSLTNYSTASNNNCFYAGTPSATNLIFYDGTNGDSLLADYQTRVSPADGSSLTENVAFLSARDLHINPAIPTQLESGALPITSPPITTDFDYQTRNATTPDIGADEGTFIPLDISGPIISYTTLRHSNVTTARTLTATITDASGVDTSASGRPRLWYRTGTSRPLAGPYTAISGVFVSGNDWNFTIPAQASGTWVEYYVAAQDLVIPPNVTTNPPGSGLTYNPPNCSTMTNPRTYAIRDPLDFTVGATGADFVTLTEGISVLSNGIDANARLLLQSDYSSAGEVFPITINTFPGLDDVFKAIDEGNQPRGKETWAAPFDENTNLDFLKTSNAIPGLGENNGTDLPKTLTIKPDSGVTATISGPAFSIFTLAGARNVIIDGSNSIGGTTRDLTIQNDSTGSYTYGVLILGAPGYPASYNQIKNCIVRCGVPYTSSNWSRTIGEWGSSSDQLDTGTVIQNCDISNFTYFGIYMQNVEAGIIENNYIHDVEMNATVDYRAVWLASYTCNCEFRNNTVGNLLQHDNNWWVYGGFYTSSTVTSNHLIYNNMFYNIASVGAGSSTNYGYAIYSSSSTNDGDKYYYNSIYLFGDDSSTSTSSRSVGFYMYGTNLELKNNSVYNAMNMFGGNSYGIYIPSTSTSFTSDFNNWYVTGSNGYVGYLSGSGNLQTLANWQSATGQDSNSINVDPMYVSTSDLHIQPTSSSLNRLATPITITTDFDGDTRHPNKPDIGADEYSLDAPSVPTLISPPNVATDIPIDGQLVWNTAAGATNYDVYLDEVTPPVVQVSTFQTDTFFAYTGLDSAKTYYWQVVAINDTLPLDASTPSAIWSFTTVGGGVPPTGNWDAMADVPAAPSGKNPKSGSCMAGLDATGLIYFLKASNRPDFYSYTPDVGTGTWTTLTDMPEGDKETGDGKHPKRGAAMAAYEPGKRIFVLRGNNRVGFWKYQCDTLEDTMPGWYKLQNIPKGAKAPKYGTGLVHVRKGDKDYLFCMKGAKTSEFYLYDIETNTWALVSSPGTGTSRKVGYKKGSCLAYDGSEYVYVLQGYYGSFFRYRVESDSWAEMKWYDYKTYVNRDGKKKKPKDGAALVYYNNGVYMLKGGNTVEVWKYDVMLDEWSQMPAEWDIPVGSNKKKVKDGGGMIKFGDFFWASKGKNTPEFYRHNLLTDAAAIISYQPTNEGTMENKVETGSFNLTIAPNPAINVSVIRYTLPVPGPVSIKLYDVTGTLVKSYTNTNPTKNGVLMLDAKTLPAGVYILRFNSGDIRVTKKLVLEK